MLAVLFFWLGASIGSFVNVVADRLPLGQSLVYPASHCPVCNTALRPVDLVPILSYLWLRGRCRYCGAPIPARVPLIEALMGVLLTLAFIRYGLTPGFVVAAVAIALLTAISLIDLEHGIIPNRLVIPAAVVALAISPLWPSLEIARPFLGGTRMVASLESSVASGAGAFLIFLAIFLVYPGGMGAGDVKLAGMLGLLLGFPATVVAIWLAMVGGGLVAATLLLFKKLGRKTSIPFGPFLGSAAVVTLLGEGDLISLYERFFPTLSVAIR